MKDRTLAALAYDFDGTLAPGNIQENSFIPEVGMEKEKFWARVDKVAKKGQMDKILAYMFLIVQMAGKRISGGNKKRVKITKEGFRGHGKGVKLFKGVEAWFPRINAYARCLGITLEHYIISSGTEEMIKGTSIAKYFKKIYASSFKYDKNKSAHWPAVVINYTNKTQFLFRINKGIKNNWNDSVINRYQREENRRIPFENITYVGNGSTDVPAMHIVNYKGGYTIGVFDSGGGRRNLDKVSKLQKNGRARFIAPANYEPGSALEKLVHGILNVIHTTSNLNRKCLQLKRRH